MADNVDEQEMEFENEQQISVTLQMGLQMDKISLDRTQEQNELWALLRERARVLVEKHSAESHLPLDRLMLFRHDYQSPNLLQLLNSPLQLHNGSVVEVVLASKNERPNRPHAPNVHNYMSPTFCDFCGEILVGLMKQGLKCKSCGLNFHKKCAFLAFNNCSSATESQSLATEKQTSIGLPHTFVVHSYKKPTVCKHCSKLLVGIMKQGLQCRDCKVNVHKNCASMLPYDCRIKNNQGTSFRVVASASSAEAMDQDARDSMPGRSSSDDMIPLIRLPGQASFRHSGPPSVVLEGYLLHFTNHQPDRRLRHYWVLEPGAIALYHEGQYRRYLTIQLSEVLGLHLYDGAPLDSRFPPHCFEIQTAKTIYYVGENLDWYTNNGQGGPAPKLPRRESGLGFASAEKWYLALKQALLPPPLPREPPKAEPAIKFGELYQVNATEELGSGQFGTVYGGVHRQSGREVAVKVIAKERFSKTKTKQLHDEVAILQAVSYPGIIRLESMFETKDKIFVVMEKMRADMLEMILSSRLGRLSERITKFLMVQILAALHYLHGKNIAHCDLKPENVLLSSPNTDYPQTKLCDFGYARFIGEAQFRKTVVGTPAYLAPEVLKKEGYNKSLDMWSVGVVIYVTLSGTFPFNEGEEISDQIHNAAFMYPANPWNEISRPAIDMISRLLKVQIEERLTIDQCFGHEWLQDVQLYADLRQLEQQVGGRYLTNEQDDARYASQLHKVAHSMSLQ